MTVEPMQAVDPAKAAQPASRAIHTNVTIIGAGPYGLAAGAFLTESGLDVCVLGKPMEFWSSKMPAGMLLRSPRVASNIADPRDRFTLENFEAQNGVKAQSPLPLETFVDYGLWFQRTALPKQDAREVTSVDFDGKRYISALADGTSVVSDRVVVASGIGPFQRIPSEFQSLPSEQLTHCYSGFDVRAFRGRRIAVIGAGQSALESAALLKENGAAVELIAKIETLRWIGQHPFLHKMGPLSAMLYSQHDVGPAGISRMVAAPNLMRFIPIGLRDKIRKRAVRPAGSRWLPARLAGVNMKTGKFVREANSSSSGVTLALSDGSVSVVDHVLLGTGYSVNISLLPFLTPRLLQRVSMLDGYPMLRSGFETSLPGLHFIGATAARTFGPLLYFVAGTDFAAKNLASAIRRK